MLLNIQHFTEQPLTTKDYPIQNVSSWEIELVCSQASPLCLKASEQLCVLIHCWAPGAHLEIFSSAEPGLMKFLAVILWMGKKQPQKYPNQ